MEQLSYLVALAFSPANIVATVLLLMVILYWMMVIAGLFHLHALDGHAASDAGHGDAGHGDAGHGDAGHGDAGHGDGAGGAKADAAHGSVLQIVFDLIGGAEVPATITLSFLILTLWVSSLTVNYTLGIHSFGMSILLTLPALVGCALVTKVLTWPLRALFRALGRDVDQFEEMIGRMCTVSTSKVDGGFGQVRIETDGAPIVLNARTERGEELAQGTEVIIVGYDRKTGIALVQGA